MNVLIQIANHLVERRLLDGDSYQRVMRELRAGLPMEYPEDEDDEPEWAYCEDPEALREEDGLAIERTLEARARQRISPDAQHRKPRLRARRAARKRRQAKVALTEAELAARVAALHPDWAPTLAPLALLAGQLSHPRRPPFWRRTDTPPPLWSEVHALAHATPDQLARATSAALGQGSMRARALIRLLRFDGWSAVAPSHRFKGSVARRFNERIRAATPPSSWAAGEEPWISWIVAIRAVQARLLTALATGLAARPQALHARGITPDP